MTPSVANLLHFNSFVIFGAVCNNGLCIWPTSLPRHNMSTIMLVPYNIGNSKFDYIQQYHWAAMISCHMVKSQILLLCVFYTCICHKTEVFLICLKKGSTYLHRSCSCMHACVLVVVIVCLEMELLACGYILLSCCLSSGDCHICSWWTEIQTEIVELGLLCF